MRFVIAAGGTAGHVNPALALAAALRGNEVAFIGTSRGAEASLVPAAGLELHTIEVGGFDRARPLRLPSVALRAAGAARAARRLLKELGPEVVVGMGGYVSLPVCVAARSLGIPIVIHEQNIVMGLANRRSKRLARAVAVSFEETLSDAGPLGVLTGNPVMPEVKEADIQAERRRAIKNLELDPYRRTLLVFGGSLGAQRVNEAASGLGELWNDRDDLQVVHIVGRTHATERYSPAAAGPLIYRTVGYMDRLIEAYAIADLALCRGGASTVAELCVVGLPSIIVPYPYHRDRQQERHAAVLMDAGAAVVLGDTETTASTVAELAGSLLHDPARLAAMAASARALGRPDADERLAAVAKEAA